MTKTEKQLLPWQHDEEFQLGKLIEGLKARGSSTDLVTRAYECAAEAHEGQHRKTGEPYMMHPLAVANILNEFELNQSVIVAALLHDVVEDTNISIQDITTEFGEEIGLMVDGVTKLEDFQFKTEKEARAASMSKMMKAVGQDLNILFIKLADRLHNMNTLGALPRKRQSIIAIETLNVYGPLASRLGMYELSCQLEDLAFATLHSKWFAEIDQMVETRSPERELYLTQIQTQVAECLSGAGIEANVFIRPKHLWSIYKKIELGREFEEIHDLMGLRVVVKNVTECYTVLGLIHSIWHAIPGRFKDHIAVPKFNLYQSLHTTVMGPSAKPLEVQIRTQEMDDRAERGIAAHWAYKDVGDDDISMLDRMIDWAEEASNPIDFIDTLHSELEQEEIVVFTPSGDLVSLPVGSTLVDFAYAVQEDLGNKIGGAKVNGNSVKLSTTLNQGDVVEIISSQQVGPLKEWLDFVVSRKARNKIMQWFKSDAGKEGTKTDPKDEKNDKTSKSQKKNLVRLENNPTEVSGFGVLVEGQDDVWVRLGQCCSPNRSDEIVGFVTRGKGVSVHARSCKNIDFLSEDPSRLIHVEWDNWQRPTEFIDVKIKALDRAGLLRDILSVMPPNAFIGNMTSRKGKNGVAEIKFQLEISNIVQADIIVKNIKQVDSVYAAALT